MRDSLASLNIDRRAEFSACRRYRYALWRTWNAALPKVLFIALNPSVADEQRDDPTLRRCMAYGRAWGYGGVCVGNLFALVSRDPRLLSSHTDPVGAGNDDWLIKLQSDVTITLAAWGNRGFYLNRAQAVVKMLPILCCLGVTKTGQPMHPLYQSADLEPQVYQRGVL